MILLAKSKKKIDYEKTFNEIFGTNIKWSKLSVDELEEFAEALVNNNEQICGNLCKPSTSLSILIDKIVPPEEQGPVIRLLKGLLKH